MIVYQKVEGGWWELWIDEVHCGDVMGPKEDAEARGLTEYIVNDEPRKED